MSDAFILVAPRHAHFSAVLVPCGCEHCNRIAQANHGARQLRLQVVTQSESGDGLAPVPLPVPNAPAAPPAGVQPKAAAPGAPLGQHQPGDADHA